MIRFVKSPAVVAAHSANHPRCISDVVDRLAEAICEIGGAGEPVTEEALLARDFSPDVVRRLAPQARAAARRRFIKHV